MGNSREIYLDTLLFGTPDRIPFEPGKPREKTLARWQQEGLPEGEHWYSHLCEQIGIDAAMQKDPVGEGFVNFRMNPRFEEKILEHRDGHYIVQDWMGNITEISDEYDFTYIREPKDFVTRRWHAFPVEIREDFEAMKLRFDPADPARYPADFDTRVADLKSRDSVLTLNLAGPFWQLREWVGFEPLCMLFLEDPGFVQEMITFYEEFVSRTMKRALKAGIVDRIWINEDMAFKERSMISPEMTREFLLPTWKRWVGEARLAGVSILDMDSDGYIEDLVPIWIEAGFNVCDPVEVAAGNDISRLRREYGSQMAFRMGVDKRKMAAGGRELEAELDRLAPVIMDGGYIPGCDHGVPHDVSWQNFVDYSTQLAKLTGWK
jgi:uroporphyrinogen decarboxylase